MAESDGEGLTIRWPVFDGLCRARGWNTDPDRARGLGFSYQMLNHMRRGRCRPGAKVVTRCLAVFGADIYHVLFDDPSERAAA